MTSQPTTPQASDDSVITLSGMLLSVGLPTAAYYGLRLIGITPLPALLAITAVSSISTVIQLVRSRRILGLNSAFLFFTVVGIGQSLLHGNPRFLLMVDALITGTTGVWIVATAASDRPSGSLSAVPCWSGASPSPTNPGPISGNMCRGSAISGVSPP